MNIDPFYIIQTVPFQLQQRRVFQSGTLVCFTDEQLFYFSLNEDLVITCDDMGGTPVKSTLDTVIERELAKKKVFAITTDSRRVAEYLMQTGEVVQDDLGNSVGYRRGERYYHLVG